MIKTLGIMVAALAILALAAVASISLIFPGPYAPPPDAEMIANLEKHRATFDKLITMIREDKGLERIDDDWTRPDDPATVGVSPARVAEYRRLFAEARIPRGFYSFHNATKIIFIYFAAGLSVSGCSKSYIFTTNTPEDLVDEPLDTHHRDNKAYVTRRIGENWYLQYDSS